MRAFTLILIVAAELALVSSCGRTSAGTTGTGNGNTQNSGSGTPVMIGTCNTGGKPFGAGDGSVANPYQICSGAQLIAASSVDYQKSNFVLLSDLDVSAVSVVTLSNFQGSFDGGQHTIANYQGFGPLFDSNYGTISNLNFINVNMSSSYKSGILVGTNQTSGTVTNCHVSGSLASPYQTGGLVGVNNGHITLSSASVNLSGTDHLGGLVGENSGTIDRCWSSGSVQAAVSDAGGLVGEGLGGTIVNSYSLASVSTPTNSGGFIGTNAAGISNCFSTGQVVGSGAAIGGFAGKNTGTVTGSYWNTTTSGQGTSASGAGETTAQMQSISTFSGWDFSTIWNSPSSGQYPSLR